jgi:class 3 adenylate cyclase
MAERNKVSEVPLQVKIGIHVGEPILKSDDFYGAAVNYAARVQSQAGGSEVVISRLTNEILGTFGDISTEERAPVILKGFEGPQILYTVMGTAQ